MSAAKRSQMFFAGAAGTLAIACVAGPFAALGQRHASHEPAPPPVHHASPTVVVAEEAPTTTAVPSAPIVHTFRVADLATDSRVTLTSGNVGRRPFLTALVQSGISPKEAHRVLVAFSGIRNLDRCDAADAFTIARATSDNHVVAFELVPAKHAASPTDPIELFQAREEDSNAKLLAKRVEIAVARKHIAAALVVDGDLRASIGRAVGDESNEELLSLIDDALDGRAELSDLHAGSRLRLVATEERIEGVMTGWAELDAIEYTPFGKPPLRVYWFAKGSSQPPPQHGKEAHHPHRIGGFYDAQGRQPYHGGWRSPVPMARISSRYNPNRMHPVLHVVMPHNGVDFAASAGTPVYAAASGIVKSAGDGGPCGNMVQIDHPNGLTSAYCHLSRFGPISPGQHVETRQLIGYVGQTGRATGPHLHFAVKRGDIFLDPMTMRLDGVRMVPPRLKSEFEELRAKLDGEIDAVALPAPLVDAAAPESDEPAEP